MASHQSNKTKNRLSKIENNKKKLNVFHDYCKIRMEYVFNFLKRNH